MADFASWSDLQTAVRNALANRDLAVGSYRAPDGTSLTYRTWDELQAIEAWVADKVATAAATSGAPTRRAYVRPQGSGW